MTSRGIILYRYVTHTMSCNLVALDRLLYKTLSVHTRYIANGYSNIIIEVVSLIILNFNEINRTLSRILDMTRIFDILMDFTIGTIFRVDMKNLDKGIGLIIGRLSNSHVITSSLITSIERMIKIMRINVEFR